AQQAATRNRGKTIVNSLQPIYDQEPSMVAKDDETSKDKEIDKLMALISLPFKKIYKPTNNNLRTSINTSHANQDNSPRINRSAGYKNQRIGNVVGAREAVGSTVVSPDAADSGPIFDDEPLQKVLTDNHYNVFAIESAHPEQSKPVHDTYPIEQDAQIIIINSLDMNYDREEIDQNDDDNDLAKEHEVTNLQCDYLELLEKCERLETELLKTKMMSKSFESVQKHAINLEVEDLKAQLQDKGIVISELKKLIEKLKEKSVDTKFEKSSVIRQPNAFKSQRPSVLGKPTTFSNCFTLPPNKKSILKNTKVLAPGMYKLHTDHNQTRTSQLPQDSRKTNKHVSFSTGLIPTTSVSRPQLKSNQIGDRVMRNNSQGKKVLNAKTLNVKSIFAMCDKCVLIDKHAMCVLHSVDKPIKKTLIEIFLFIIDSGCSKHMTGNLKLLINFVEKFLGTVEFGNDQIAPILGYGDLVQGAVTIKRVYYVEGLNHILFSVGQFHDADLEVAFRKSTCYIRDLKGNDLLTVINKCLSGKSTGYDSLRLSQAQILWGMYHKKNVDFAYLLWEDYVYQVKHKDAKKSNEMYYPRFIKVIINFFMTKDPSIPRRNKVNWHYVRDDQMFTMIKLVSRHQNTQQFGAMLPVELTNEDIRNSATYKEYYAIISGATPPKTKASVRKTQSSSNTTIPPPMAIGTRLSTSAKGKQPANSSKAKGLYVLSEVALTEAEQPQKEAYNKLISLKLVDLVQMKELILYQGNDDESHGMNFGGDEGPDAADDDEELYRDVNINLEGRDSSSVSSQFVTSMLNPSPDASIDSLFESTHRVDVPVSTTVVPLLMTAPTLPPLSIPIMSQFAEAVSSIPGIVDRYIDHWMNEAVKLAVQSQSDRLREEAQAKNEYFLNKLDENI
nr:integrase, catalytic region, zinc finger, CCHC-type, peptidase aspartic, catalytic [Tanacetum cinerariifolium]